MDAKPTAELAAKLDRIPPRKLDYKGTTFEEMDVDAILARKPAVVVVDELAHTNIEGSKHAKRYEDVMELLDAKIDVLSTMNVQHVESVGPTVQQITGVQVRETVPDWVMQRVDEIVLADLTPQALQKRMQRGDIYPIDRAQRALSHFFRPGNLIALRELALRQVTGVVDRSLDAFLEKDGDSAGAHRARADWRLRQFQSGGTISDCPRIAHGAGAWAANSTCSMSMWAATRVRKIRKRWPKIFASRKILAPRWCAVPARSIADALRNSFANTTSRR